MRPSRSRARIAALLAVTIALGLATRPLRRVIDPALAENLGDILWAVCAWLALAFICPRAPGARLAGAAVAIAFAVEFSQLYHAPWIDALRRTFLGGLALGWGFAWGDLVCYAAGVAACWIFDRAAH